MADPRFWRCLRAPQRSSCSVWTEVMRKCFAFISTSSLWCIANAAWLHSYKVHWGRWRMHVFPDLFAVVNDEATACTQKWSSSVQLSSLHPGFHASPTHRGRIVTKCIQPDGGCTFLQISPRSSKMKPRRLHRSDPQVFSVHKSFLGTICAQTRTQNVDSIKSSLWAKSIKPLNFSRFTDTQKHAHRTQTLRFQITNHF